MKMDHDEIKCYASSKAVYVFAGMMFLLALAGLSAGFGDGPFYAQLPALFSGILVLVGLWILIHPKSYISIDKTDGMLRSSVFGFKTWEIPISSITRIETAGSFLGAIKIITISHRKPNGVERTVRAGSKQTYDKASLHKVLRGLVEVNPTLHMPSDLEN